MIDRVEKFSESLIQHGPLNDRVYLLKLAAADLPGIASALTDFAEAGGYGKITAKVPLSAWAAFEESGYIWEACAPRFFKSGERVIFCAKFPDPARAVESHPEILDRHLTMLDKLKKHPDDDSEFADQTIQICRASDANEMSAVYREVYATYPWPIHHPDYIMKTMDSHVRYYGIRQNGRIAALASCEMDRENRNVEMTDFAVIPEHRGKGLSKRILKRMERDMGREGFHTAYTISRTLSLAINIIFKKRDYTFSGILVNNSNIAGDMESMLVWHKNISTTP